MKKFCWFLSLFLATLFFSCKKLDHTPQNIGNTQIERQFFNFEGAAPAVVRAANSLKKQGGLMLNLAKFTQKNGIPRWNKTKFTGSPDKDLRYRDSVVVGIETELNMGVFFVPLINENDEEVASYLVIFQHNPDFYSYRLYNKEELAKLDPPSELSEKHRDLTLAIFSFFEKEIFDRDSIVIETETMGAKHFNPFDWNLSVVESSGMTCYQAVRVVAFYSASGFPFYFTTEIRIHCSSTASQDDGENWQSDGSFMPGTTSGNPSGVPPGGGDYSPTNPSGNPQPQWWETPTGSHPGSGGIGHNQPIFYNPFEDENAPEYSPGFYSTFYPWWNPFIGLELDFPFHLSEELADLRASLSLNSAQVDYLHQHPDRVAEIKNFLDGNMTASSIRVAVLHIDEMMSDPDYQAMVEDYDGANQGNMWWEDADFVNDLAAEAGLPDLTFAEKELVLQNPIAAFRVWGNVKISIQQTLNRYGFNGRNDRSDAFRHACWFALNAKKVGARFALAWGYAHESDVPPSLQMEKDMDLHNNGIGIDIGIRNTTASDNEIANLVQAAVNNGDCVYLYPLSNDPVYAPTFGIFPGTLLVPTN